MPFRDQEFELRWITVLHVYVKRYSCATQTGNIRIRKKEGCFDRWGWWSLAAQSCNIWCTSTGTHTHVQIGFKLPLCRSGELAKEYEEKKEATLKAHEHTIFSYHKKRVKLTASTFWPWESYMYAYAEFTLIYSYTVSFCEGGARVYMTYM